MNKDFLNFLKDAYNNGLCKEYQNEIRKCHGEALQLVKLAMRQQSIPWVATKLHEGVVTKEYVENTFGNYLNNYVLDDCDEVKNYKYKWVFDYQSDNTLLLKEDVIHISFTDFVNAVIPQTLCPTVYISNKSNVHIVCEGFNSIRIMLFDSSKLVVEDADEESNVIVYRYSDDARVECGKYCLGDIREFRKDLRLQL